MSPPLVLLALTLTAFGDHAEAAKLNMTGCKSSLPYKVNAIFQHKGDIYSPGYLEGEVYPNYLYCEYTIVAPSGYKIRLTFKDIDIDPLDMCGNDMMYIYDGSSREGTLRGVYCGSEPPDPFISAVNAVHILFVSNYIAGKKGYHIQYEAIPREKVCPNGMELCQNMKCFDPALKCNGKDDCGDGTDEENCDLPIPSTDCGVPTFKPIEPASYPADRIIGGLEVREGSWPWQADMQIKYYYPNGHTCGGTLVHPEWVMTAMHCLRGHPAPEDWRVHLGNHHKFIRDPHEQVRYVKRIVIYPGFSNEEILGKHVDMKHDIALMKLNAPVKITDYVKPACLPTFGYAIPVRTTCIATGWGTTRGSGHSEALKQVDLTIQPIKTCPGATNDTQICVKNSKGFQDVCHGDSGGPLVCKIAGKWNVMGITSYGTESNMMSGLCALAKAGTVFNRVAAKTTWINDMIEKFS